MHPVRLAVAALVFFAAGAAPAFAVSTFCSDTDAQNADKVVYTIGNWQGVRIFYDRYGACDDGDVSLELSDRVSDLLANHWDTLDKLKILLGESDQFKKFIFYHIDPTVMSQRFPAILDNAKNHCPVDDADLCQQITAAATSATPQDQSGGN